MKNFLLFSLIVLSGVSLKVNAQNNPASPHDICFGSIEPYRVDTTGAAGSTYNWGFAGAGFTGTITGGTSSAVSIDWDNTPTGSYSLFVVEDSANGCSGDTVFLTVNVNPLPAASATAGSPVCEGSDLTLNASGGTSYDWSGPNGFTSANQNPTRTNITLADSGIYTVTVTNASGCEDTAQVRVIVNPNAALALTSGAGSDSVLICEGSALTAVTYSVTGGGSGASVTGLPGGVTGNYSGGTFTLSGTPTATGVFNYEVVTTGGGCAQDTLTGIIEITPAPVVNAGSDQTICEGEIVDLANSSPSASNNSGLTWSTSGNGTYNNAGILNPEYTAGTADIANGTVTLTLTAAGNAGCPAATDDLTVTINPKPVTSSIFHN